MIAYVGIGANLGDARANVVDALARLAALPGASLVRASGLYRSAPVDAGGDDYINAVACLDTTLSGHELLSALHGIELAHGRERPYRNAPRTLDLDLLLYGDQVIRSATLCVPHPRMHERAFVLAPLLEIAPDAQIPGLGPARDFAPHVADQAIARMA
ncbi:2-amino-4-hydroxy-6-hydroxymethyldihydropteridine diphosphokinase [Massilia niastensis]|uniref:2-amino-4-hydroxy-6- hydroxymethyldihydropteridine diphosphokinase n=1 Tax=Massilia niastensis TaxID=544911 RepID=UPI00037FD702|nr:2-amino-4-hydroxy-6-hydroxymethyldihydropteridine diphosphokinase [Massilia niastensis]